MKIHDVLTPSFKQLRHQLGHDRPRDSRPMWQQRLSADSDFCRAAVAMGYLSEEQMQRAARRYRLGRSRDGGVIFWQIDQLEQLYDGKIMYYRPDCHRDHERHPQWVTNLLKRHYLRGYEDLAASIPSLHCLFGNHLITGEPLTNNHDPLTNNHDPLTMLATPHSRKENHQPAVAVVEAEKTAVIMSEHYPDYLWLAAGGLYELTAQKLFPLKGRRIILLPDTDPDGKAYATWYHVMLEAQRLLGQPIHLSPLLERKASADQKQRKIDILDFVFEQ